MKDFDHLEDHFKRGRKWLVTAGSEAFLLSDRDALQRAGAGQVQIQLLDVQTALHRFVTMLEALPPAPLNVGRISLLCGQNYSGTYKTLHGTVLDGGARIFTLPEAFALSLAASLKRSKVHPEAIRAAAQLIAGRRVSSTASKGRAS